MPNDGGVDNGGVDATSGACPPPKKKKEETKDGKKTRMFMRGMPGQKAKLEECSSKRPLKLKRGTCSWFLIEVRGKRLPAKMRGALIAQIRALVSESARSIPSHL